MSEEKAVQHFNKSVVWGRVDGVPSTKKSDSGKGRRYLRLKVVCANPKYGNVLAYGRIWNQEKIDSLVDYLKKNPGAAVKLTGFINQYDHVEGEGSEAKTSRRSNFTWYDWAPDKCENPRASFIMVGKIKAIKDDTVIIRLERKGNDPEEFEVYPMTGQQLKGIIEDDTVKVKGYVRALNPEDEFGDTTNAPIRPYIEEIELTKGEFS